MFVADGLAGAAAAPTQAASSGLLASARNAITAGGTRGMLTRFGRGAGLGMAGGVVGGMLDESSLLGGSEGAANDYLSKALKGAGIGAGLATAIPVPGVSTLVGGLVGAGVGLGWEGLERAGRPLSPDDPRAGRHDHPRRRRRSP
jgi:hypothetical protein